MDSKILNVLHDCLKGLPLIFTFCASFMLIRNKLRFSAENTITLWTTAADEVMRSNIASEHANALVGFTFLLISIILQIFNLSLPITWESFRRIEKVSVLILIVVLFVLLFVGDLISKQLKKRFLTQIAEREKTWPK